MPKVSCPACGRSWAEGAIFCGICGSQLPGSPSQATARRRSAPQCPGESSWKPVARIMGVVAALTVGVVVVLAWESRESDRVDGGVAVPEDGDLQGVASLSDAATPEVECERDGRPIDCVRWMRQLRSGSPDSARQPWSVMVTSEYVLAKEGTTIVSMSRPSGRVEWEQALGGPTRWFWQAKEEMVALQPSRSVTLALSTADGSERWSAKDAELVLAPPNTSGLYTSHFEDDQWFLTARADDGSVRWRHPFGNRGDGHGSAGPSQLHEAGPFSFVNVATPDKNTDLVALDRETGTERWQRSSSRPLHATQDVAVVVDIERPAGEEDTSAPESPTALVGVGAADGIERWRYELAGSFPEFAIAHNVVVMADERQITAIDVKTGEPRWQTGGEDLVRETHREVDLGAGAAPLVLTMDHENRLVARFTETGEQRWHTQLDEPVRYVTKFDGLVLAHVTDTSFLAFDLASGDQLAMVRMETNGSPRFVAEDVLVYPESGWMLGIDVAAAPS